jgi:ADP-heptose:LPS heptosyltransferase
MRKILVLRGGALGDFIVTLPALAALRRRWPAAGIELIGNATAARLATARSLVDRAHSQHDRRWSALFAQGRLPHELATWLSGFDLVINFWPDADGTLRDRFPVRPGQVVLHADALPTRAPAAAHYCQPLMALGIEPARLDYPFVDASSKRSARSRVAIHPGSGSPRKNWPAENWIELVESLPAPILLVLGEVELESWASRRLPAKVAVAANRHLEELITELAESSVFVGHDSGISHLAAACGVPSVLLFGPTDPAMWAPPVPHVRVIRRGEAMDRITVSEVRAAVMAALA